MRTGSRSIDIEHAVGRIGLLLMLVMGSLAERGYPPHTTGAARICGFFARRAIDGIAVIGWLADRLPPTDARPTSSSPACHQPRPC